MRRFLLVVVIMVTVAGVDAFAQRSKSELQKIYMDLAMDVGLQDAFVDSDGDVQFTYGENDYYIGINEGDQEFVRVVLWNLYSVDTASDAFQAIYAASVVTRDRKVVKAYVSGDEVIIAAELFVGDPQHIAPVFERVLDEIDTAATVFWSNM